MQTTWAATLLAYATEQTDTGHPALRLRPSVWHQLHYPAALPELQSTRRYRWRTCSLLPRSVDMTMYIG